MDEQFLEDLCEKTWRSQKSFVYLRCKYEKHICIVNKKNQMTKIRVNTTNSKVLDGRLFISLLKAVLVSKSKVLAELIEYSNSIVFPDRISEVTGELVVSTKYVEYKGAYIRVKK